MRVCEWGKMVTFTKSKIIFWRDIKSHVNFVLITQIWTCMSTWRQLYIVLRPRDNGNDCTLLQCENGERNMRWANCPLREYLSSPKTTDRNSSWERNRVLKAIFQLANYIHICRLCLQYDYANKLNKHGAQRDDLYISRRICPDDISRVWRSLSPMTEQPWWHTTAAMCGIPVRSAPASVGLRSLAAFGHMQSQWLAGWCTVRQKENEEIKMCVIQLREAKSEKIVTIFFQADYSYCAVWVLPDILRGSALYLHVVSDGLDLILIKYLRYFF